MGFYSKSFRFEGGGRYKIKIGLKRSGKSCRLRWVNYLNPGLKRGKMTPQEEHQILGLHTKWGNRWSKIARKLPGRTDNEIKNYWRTHMRKMAQKNKRMLSPSPSMSNSSAYSSITSNPTLDSMPATETIETVSFINDKNNNNNKKNSATSLYSAIEGQDAYDSMDDIWKDIALLDDDDDGVTSVFGTYSEITPSSIWDYPLNTSWTIDGEDEVGSNMFWPRQQASDLAQVTWCL
ncbi:hypothetical protein R6Q57_002280 [Mikania cordata]